jgi:hypothetical protein
LKQYADKWARATTACPRIAAIGGYKINGQQLFYPNANDPDA